MSVSFAGLDASRAVKASHRCRRPGPLKKRRKKSSQFREESVHSFLPAMATPTGAVLAERLRERASSSGRPAPEPKPAPASNHELPPRRRRTTSLPPTNSKSTSPSYGGESGDAAEFVETWKVCVCGVGGSGKSCFVNRFVRSLVCGRFVDSSPRSNRLSGQIALFWRRCLALDADVFLSARGHRFVADVWTEEYDPTIEGSPHAGHHPLPSQSLTLVPPHLPR
jgi:hypothetical protein